MREGGLSSRPWEAIRQALEDLRACEKDSRYQIDMRRWHLPGRTRCQVCLAGAVMAQRIGVEPEEEAAPNDFCGITEARLIGLDAFRVGNYSEGLRLFEGGWSEDLIALADDRARLALNTGLFGSCAPMPYSSNRELFYSDMEKVAAALEEVLG